MVDSRILNIVNDNDEIIGEKTREEIHNKGLLHRETHIWFFTPNGEIIFQHRAKDKDTFPDLLDATVGGHVEIGESYEETAIKECEEETGLKILKKDLIPIKKFKYPLHDSVTNKINNSFKMEYGLLYKGDVKDLKMEEGKIIGFEKVSINTLFNPTEEDRKKFIPAILEPIFLEVFSEIKNYLSSNIVHPSSRA